MNLIDVNVIGSKPAQESSTSRMMRARLALRDTLSPSH